MARKMYQHTVRVACINFDKTETYILKSYWTLEDHKAGTALLMENGKIAKFFDVDNAVCTFLSDLEWGAYTSSSPNKKKGK